MLRRYDYDLVVIGSGDAGGEAAILAAKDGLRVALVENNKWGGSRINSSDVPVGALLHISEVLHELNGASKLGINSTNVRYNYPTINNWKNVAMRRANANSKKSFEEAGIECIEGTGRIISKHEVSVDDKTITAAKILIATGTAPLDTGIKIQEGVDYWLRDDVISMVRPPKSIFIVGAGSTGCEFAQFFSALGTAVVIADIAGRLLPREDEEVGQVLDEIFTKEHIKVLTQTRVVAIEDNAPYKRVVFMRGGEEKSIRVDEVLLCTGSAPNIEVGLENAGIKHSANGITVDSFMRTSAKNIFAAGDVVGGHSSTEKALIDARVAVSHIEGGRSKISADYRGLIRVTNTYPEIAEVGVTEDDCIKSDRKYNKIVLPLDIAQKANISNFYGGFIKIIASKGGRILGGTIMAPGAAVIAQELAFAVRYDMNVYEIALAPHVANDWGEIVRVACEQLCK